MFWTFKLSFDVVILASLDLPTVLATFSKIWAIFSNLLVTLHLRKTKYCYPEFYFCYFCGNADNAGFSFLCLQARLEPTRLKHLSVAALR
jgi:hypothetical protein